MPPTAWEFQNRLAAILNGARYSGQLYVDVESGKLHEQAGGHPLANHQKRICCDVMIKMMRAGDAVVKESGGGQDQNLIIRYNLRAIDVKQPKN
jgi:hypothetical protein